jgi:hypothetical protein
VASRAVQALVPAAAVAVGLVMLVVETAGPTHELQLVAPSEAAPGEVVPLRAQLFAGIERPQGPELAEADVEVALLPGAAADGAAGDGAAAAVARTRLVPGAARSMEGRLAVPTGLPIGPYRLVASSEGARVTAPIRLAAAPAPLGSADRAGSALQGLWLGPVEASPGAVAPDALDVRVDGAVCVPEQPCALLVRVGAPPAAVRLEASPSVEPLAPPGATAEGLAPPSAERTDGVVRLEVRVHGFEAETTLLAYRDDAVVARRPLRLPVSLGEPACLAPRRIAAGASPPLAVRGAQPDRGVIVDAFLDGRWRHTASFAPAALAEPRPLPFALSAGTWRLQARSDPFSSSAACARTIVAGDVAAASLATDAQERAAAATTRDDALLLAYLLADDDADRVATPPPASGRDEAIARTVAAQRDVRVLAVAVLLFCAVVMALFVVRRGLAASAEARRLLREAGAVDADDPSRRRRDLWTVLLIAAAIALAFLVAAVFVVARTALAPPVD